jgi:hypothetical protein
VIGGNELPGNRAAVRLIAGELRGGERDGDGDRPV